MQNETPATRVVSADAWDTEGGYDGVIRFDRFRTPPAPAVPGNDLAALRRRVDDLEAEDADRDEDGPSEVLDPVGKVVHSSSSSSSGEALPWTIALINTGGTWICTFRNCGYVRGPVTRILGTLGTLGTLGPYALVADGGAGDYFVGLKINTVTGIVDPTLLCSKTASDVYDTTPPSDEFFKKLLYVLTYAAVPDTDPAEYKWTVKAGWYRLLPELGAYV